MAPPEAEGITPEGPNPLVSLARGCVVRVERVDGTFRGSGFFVLPGVVLTCGHVVHGAGRLRAVWGKQRLAQVAAVKAVPPREQVLDPARYPLPDLALLQLNDEVALAGHPCVRFAVEAPAAGVDADRFHALGYTREHDGSLPALNAATVGFESVYSEPDHDLWKLQQGEVPHGLSGGLLLNLRTGAVVGVVESSRGPQSLRGGFAVPVAELDRAFPGLLDANRKLHESGPMAGVWAVAVWDEAARVAERAGRRERLPLVAPVEELPWRPGDSTTELLRPVYAVVQYVGRQVLRDAMAAWCDEPAGEPVGLWFVTGGGGFGKTRLGIELCRTVAGRGWTTGLLDAAVTGGGDLGLGELAAWPGRLLVVVDYAEARPAAVKDLVKRLRRRSSGPPVRIVALVRRRMTRAELVDHFDVAEDMVELTEPGERPLAQLTEVRQVLEAEFDEAPRDAGFRQLLGDAVLSRLDETTEEVDRLELFRTAHDEFARRHERPPLGPAERPPRLRARRAKPSNAPSPCGFCGTASAAGAAAPATHPAARASNVTSKSWRTAPSR
jgi:hypothetical protein